MNYGSVCSGIEAASVAWHHLGWRASWLSEIEPFPSAVLAHHYPDVPNLGDMTKIAALVRGGEVTAPDILVGGTPCQAFSVAGLRGGLSDPRGALTLAYVELANEIDSARSVRGELPCVVLWENVPGVLSTKDNAFGCFLGGLAGEGCELKPPRGKWANAGIVLGPQRTVAWRILDAQYFGVAQRRRRVFVVASARKGFDPAAVLFEFDGVRRDSAPSREAREAAPTTSTRGTTGGGLRTDFGCDDETVMADCLPTMPTPSASGGGHRSAVATGVFFAGQGAKAGSIAYDENIAPTLKASDSGTNRTPSAHIGMQVRRLTPEECEALQGFPRGYTAIPWRKKPASECPDGPRYKALGNSMCTNVMAWIGRRIAAGLS